MMWMLVVAMAQEAYVIEEAPKHLLARLDRAREESDWKQWFELAEAARGSRANRLARGGEGWEGVAEHLRRTAPRQAVEWYRAEFGAQAAAEVRAARAAGDAAALEAVVERRYFADATMEALGALGNLAFDEGRNDAAIHWWRLLREHPSREVPREVIDRRIRETDRRAGDPFEQRRKWVEPDFARWRFDAIDACVAAAHVDGRDVILIAGSTEIVALNPSRGVLWREPVRGTVQGIAMSGERAVIAWSDHVACHDAVTGRVRWTTAEGRLRDAMRAATLEPKFQSEPVACGEGVAIAVDERIACFDLGTGGIRWATFVASPLRADAKVRTTLLAREGELFVQSNIGVVAALDATSGRLSWAALTGDRNGIRPPCAPVLFEGRLFVLAQGNAELQVFDGADGSRREFRITRDIAWGRAAQLVGMVGRWLVIAGEPTHVVEVDTARAYALPMAALAGRAAIDGETVWVPTREGLLAFHGAGSFWNVSASRLAQGRILIAGGHLVHVTNGAVTIHADAETLRRENEARLDQSPTDAAVRLEMALKLSERGLWRESKAYWAEFLRLR